MGEGHVGESKEIILDWKHLFRKNRFVLWNIERIPYRTYFIIIEIPFQRRGCVRELEEREGEYYARAFLVERDKPRHVLFDLSTLFGTLAKLISPASLRWRRCFIIKNTNLVCALLVFSSQTTCFSFDSKKKIIESRAFFWKKDSRFLFEISKENLKLWYSLLKNSLRILWSGFIPVLSSS